MTEATEKDRRAARLIERALEAAVGPYIPGEPRGLSAAHAGEREAPRFADTLAALEGIERFDRASFRTAYLDGALAEWRHGGEVVDGARETTIRAWTCPLRSAATLDPRVCAGCRAFQEGVARAALPGEVEAVTFERLITRGDPVCETTIRWRREPSS
ncbi:MAG TPA: hypothetical protein VI997_10460 [Candidatus Thermoplasmatota archaeon]|nr:hypothetical protein [Candidatus Thermoplasmatota archaeon]